MLNRAGISKMIRDCLKADVATLYGPGKLLSAIESNPVLFGMARVDNLTPFKMYLWARDKSKASVGSQNNDSTFVVNYRIEGLNVDPENVAEQIDEIDEQIELLINEQMYSGNHFVGYYTDSKAQVYDTEYDSSALEVKTVENNVRAECEGAITIRINRIK